MSHSNLSKMVPESNKLRSPGAKALKLCTRSACQNLNPLSLKATSQTRECFAFKPIDTSDVYGKQTSCCANVTPACLTSHSTTLVRTYEKTGNSDILTSKVVATLNYLAVVRDGHYCFWLSGLLFEYT